MGNYEAVRAMVEGIPTAGFSPQDGKFVYDKVCELPDDALILEIGSWQGRSTCSMGFACLGTHRRIVSVDVAAEGDPVREGLRRNISAMGLRDVITELIGESHAIMKAWTTPLDFAFIDGAHDDPSVFGDFELTYPWIKRGGWVAFHDMDDPRTPCVSRMWNELASKLLDCHERVNGSCIIAGRRP